MKRNFLFAVFGLLSLALSSCDDGDIYDDTTVMTTEGRKFTVSMNITGRESWHSKYTIVVAGFNADSRYAVTSKNIQQSGNLTLTLAGVDESVKTIEVCAINQLRERIATFYTYDCSGDIDTRDTISLKVGTIDAGMFNAIQTSVFDITCAACHGKSTSAAAGLYLTEGNSYSNLVNVPAKKATDGSLRVAPGDTASSYICKVIRSTNGVHANMLSDYNKIYLIENWIKNGAEE